MNWYAAVNIRPKPATQPISKEDHFGAYDRYALLSLPVAPLNYTSKTDDS